MASVKNLKKDLNNIIGEIIQNIKTILLNMQFYNLGVYHKGIG